MTNLTRRRFTALAGASLATPLFAPAVLGQGKPKLVVIGGGPGGGTVARYVNKDHKGAIEVTLIEPQKNFTTCFFSNIYVGGYRSFKSITHNYDKVRREGVKLVHEAAASIDRDKKQVVLAGGRRVPYDRLVVAPGIDIKFDSVPGYSEAAAQVMPHAWKPGAQTELLVKKLNALKDGDTIVMIAPPNPYRCPPGPYERVSMFAHVLKQKGHKKSKIIVLDPKATFSKQALFLEGWEKHYPGMIEWQDPKVHGGIKGVDPKTGEIKTDLANYKAALANVIPAQMAGKIARDAEPRGSDRLLPDRSGEHEVEDGREHLRCRRCLHPRRHAEVGVLGQQPGQGRRDDHRRRARQGAHLPGAIFQHLLEPDRNRRRREGRRDLRAGRGQAQGGDHLRQPEGRARRRAQGELQGIGRLVREHHRRRVRMS